MTSDEEGGRKGVALLIDWSAVDGECDWSAGILACMSAKHEKCVAGFDMRVDNAAEKRGVAGRLPALQSPCVPRSNMKPNIKTLTQLTAILVAAYALKSFYSTSTVDELKWILAPTTFLVELISSEQFTFESHAGYMSSDNSFLIAASCSGVNFFLISFLLLTLGKLWRDRRISWGFLPVAALIAYSTTLVANTARIVIAMEMHASNFQLGGFDAEELHRIEGIIVYFLFLLLLFICSEKYENAKSTKSGLICLLAIYYCVTLGIPIIRGSYGRAEFWQHSAFVLVIPIVLVVPLLLFFLLNRRDPNSI